MIGQALREAREAKGCTLEEAERATRIRARYLAALEAEDFGALPSEAQARGFLRNYAQFLSLPADEVLADYGRLAKKKPRLPFPRRAASPLRSDASRKAAVETPPADPRYTPRPTPGSNAGRAPQARSRRLRLLSPDVLVAAIVTLGLGLLLLWGGSQIAAGLVVTATAPRTPVTPTRAVAATATSPAAEVAPTQPLPTPLANYVGVHVLVRAEQRVWLRVTVDGAEAFAGLMKPGDSQEFVGQSVVELVTGNGKGTRVIWNGIDQGTLGEVGEVADRLWTLDGMVIPTPTITPVPTGTPPPTRTPRP